MTNGKVSFGELLRAARLRFGQLDEHWVRVSDAGPNRWRIEVAEMGSVANLPNTRGRKSESEEHRIWYDSTTADQAREHLRPVVAHIIPKLHAGFAVAYVDDEGQPTEAG